MFRRVQPDGKVTLLWVLHNVRPDIFYNKADRNFIRHYIQSGIFRSHDGMMWRIRLEPGNWPNVF